VSRKFEIRQRCCRETKARSGFTLIEMLVVIAILGTLAMIVGPSVLGHVGEANVTAARSQIEILAVALESFRIDNHRYPTTEEGLDALRRPPEVFRLSTWNGPYLRRPIPNDPWGRSYRYRSPGSVEPDGFDLYTYGRDGEPGGSGQDVDISASGEMPRQ
jgi:general secretion pathway protein G